MKLAFFATAILLTGCATDFSDYWGEKANPRYSSVGEHRIAAAILQAGQEGGYGAARMGIQNYSYCVADAINRGYKDPAVINPILVASNHTDAAAGEMQTQILATVLFYSGDRAFATAMKSTDESSRRSASVLLNFTLRKSCLSPVNYPLTYKIIQKYAPAKG